MTNNLIDSVNSIGKRCLVCHYEIFRDNCQSDTSFVVEYLLRNMQIKESGARIRASFARAIFNAGRQLDALKIIAQSGGIPPEFSDKAKRLLGNPKVALSSAQPTAPTSTLVKVNPGEHATRPSGVSKEGSLVDQILKHGIWLPPDLLNVLPLLRPYAIRDNGCRPRPGKNEDEWGLPDSEGFFRDDNSLIKSMPYAFPVNGIDHPYHGRNIRGGFVASHGWRKLYEGRSHENPMTYSFIGHIAWLPEDLSKLTNAEGGLGQNILKAISSTIYRKFPINAKARSLLEEIWSYFPAPDVSILPTSAASRIAYFAVDMRRFSETNIGLMKVLLHAISTIERDGVAASLDKIKYGQRSLADRYSRNLPSRLVSSQGFTKLKRVVNSTITCYN